MQILTHHVDNKSDMFNGKIAIKPVKDKDDAARFKRGSRVCHVAALPPLRMSLGKVLQLETSIVSHLCCTLNLDSRGR
eukprot:816221-Amphidinium_carterae.1